MEFKYKRSDKVLRCLAEAVGLKCAVTLADGEVIKGVLRGFKYGNHFILYLAGSSKTFINFHHVTKLELLEG